MTSALDDEGDSSDEETVRLVVREQTEPWGPAPTARRGFEDYRQRQEQLREQKGDAAELRAADVADEERDDAHGDLVRELAPFVGQKRAEIAVRLEALERAKPKKFAQALDELETDAERRWVQSLIVMIRGLPPRAAAQ